MIFSNKIFKINDGKNPTLFQSDDNNLTLFIFNKTLKQYNIPTNNKINCVFLKEFSYKKIIQITDNIYCPCNNEFITKINKNDL